MLENNKPSFFRKAFILLRWYLVCLIPFLFFSGLSFWHLYNLVIGSPYQGYSLYIPEHIILAAPKLFWTGVVISGTLIVILVINDLMDGLGKVLSGGSK